MLRYLIPALVLLGSVACKSRKAIPAAPATGTTVQAPYVANLQINTAVFTPDKNPDDALICRLENHTDSMLVINLDTLFRCFTLFGQGSSQQYPMYMAYHMPEENNNDVMYIDPGKSEIIFRAPLNQVLFRQLPFSEGSYGWMWKGSGVQKANHSPVHDYDTMQKSTSVWFDVRIKGKTYTSNRAGFAIEMKK